MKLKADIDKQFRVEQPNPVVDVIAPVFGVLQHTTTTLLTCKHIASVVGKVLGCNGRLGRVVASAIGVKLFKARLGLSVL